MTSYSSSSTNTRGNDDDTGNFPQAISIKVGYDREESIARQETLAKEIIDGITIE